MHRLVCAACVLLAGAVAPDAPIGERFPPDIVAPGGWNPFGRWAPVWLCEQGPDSTCRAWSADHSLLVVHAAGRVQVLDAAGKAVFEADQPLTRDQVVFSPDGRKVALRGCAVVVVDAKATVRPVELACQPPACAREFDFSDFGDDPKGSLVCSDGTWSQRRLSDGRVLRSGPYPPR